MDFKTTLVAKTKKAISDLYSIDDFSIDFEKTNPNFSGDVTLVVFPLLRYSKKGPEETANEIGAYIKKETRSNL